MNKFLETTHLSEILEKSEKNPVIIFKYSRECNSSTRLSLELEKIMDQKKLTLPIYRVTVQTQRVLSNRIEEWFQIKHESPQIIVVKNGRVLYTAHHSGIKLEDFAK